jgi:hypothetical protein
MRQKRRINKTSNTKSQRSAELYDSTSQYVLSSADIDITLPMIYYCGEVHFASHIAMPFIINSMTQVKSSQIKSNQVKSTHPGGGRWNDMFAIP